LRLFHNNRLAAVRAGGVFLIRAALLMKRVVGVSLVKELLPEAEVAVGGLAQTSGS